MRSSIYNITVFRQTTIEWLTFTVICLGKTYLYIQERYYGLQEVIIPVAKLHPVVVRIL
jgi:hypothetical protein